MTYQPQGLLSQKLSNNKKRPFNANEQLRIFWDRTLYSEIIRRTLPCKNTRLYIYPVEDPAAFKLLYQYFIKNKNGWASIDETQRTLYPQARPLKDKTGYMISLSLQEDGEKLITWAYKIKTTKPIPHNKHCELAIHFVKKYNEGIYKEIRNNIINILDIVQNPTHH